MKKLSIVLAVAIATFTLTGCGEKAPTPEEKRIAIVNEFNALRKERDTIFNKKDTIISIKIAMEKTEKHKEITKKIDSLRKELINHDDQQRALRNSGK